MQHSESFSQVAAALARAQGVFPPIPKSKSVTVKLKSRDGQPAGSYTFRYAPLEAIIAAVRPGLSTEELCLVQAVMVDEANVEVLRTTLVHSSGEWLANEVPVFVGTGDNKSQAWSSGSSYSRRYGVTMLLCVSADEDDDGNGGEQDQPRPDYERQGRAEHRGSFPKQGGGRTSPPPRRAAPAAREEAVAGGDFDPGTGEVPAVPVFDEAQGPWGADLAESAARMMKAKAKAAGLDDAAVFERFGTITMATVNSSLAGLQSLADEAIGAG